MFRNKTRPSCDWLKGPRQACDWWKNPAMISAAKCQHSRHTWADRRRLWSPDMESEHHHYFFDCPNSWAPPDAENCFSVCSNRNFEHFPFCESRKKRTNSDTPESSNDPQFCAVCGYDDFGGIIDDMFFDQSSNLERHSYISVETLSNYESGEDFLELCQLTSVGENLSSESPNHKEGNLPWTHQSEPTGCQDSVPPPHNSKDEVDLESKGNIVDYLNTTLCILLN